ncbi:MAG: DEAD/DEAH box helicase [Planctomycetota bacterium]
MPFASLSLIEPLLRAVRSEGYSIPTAIQEQAIPHLLEGRDLLGCAQTGTGKTAAFALPILQLLAGRAAPKAGTSRAPHAGPNRVIRAMVLTPTRELAAQIGDSFGVYGQHTGLRHTVIFGGVSQGSQSQALRRGVDILVATPGRLLDLLEQKLLFLSNVEVFVLDEADRMLDMGFIRDVQRIIKHMPAQRQTLMFSATMPREIQGLADAILKNPVEVRVPSESVEADTVNQVVYFVDTHSKPALLEHLFQGAKITRALVFTRTKHRADRVARKLSQSGIQAEAMHSNKSQNARMRALANFKQGTTRVLVASDIAARGLDVDDISHVINYDMPNEAKTYVHRIGRTGRAGASGQAISFCSPDQRGELADVEQLLGKRIAPLPHSIQSPPPAERPGSASKRSGGSRPARAHHHGPTGPKGASAGHSRSDKSAAPKGKAQSPEQKKNQFWRSKRKSTPRPSRGAHPSRRRG